MLYEEIVTELKYHWEITDGFYYPEDAMRYWGDIVSKFYKIDPFLTTIAIRSL